MVALHVGVTAVLTLLGLATAGVVYIYRGNVPDVGIERSQPKGPIMEGWGAKVKPVPR